MKYLATIAVLVYMTTLIHSQPRHRSNVQPACTMTVDQLPEIRGLRLGMNVSDLVAAFPEDSSKNTIQKAITNAKKPEAYGSANATLVRRPDVNPKFSGLEAIWLELLDERLSSFTVFYDRATPWKSVDQFTGRLADAFHLPAVDHWGLQYGVRFLKCKGFTLTVFLNNGNGITVKDAMSEQVVKDRQEAAKEKTRQSFKP